MTDRIERLRERIAAGDRAANDGLVGQSNMTYALERDELVALLNALEVCEGALRPAVMIEERLEVLKEIAELAGAEMIRRMHITWPGGHWWRSNSPVGTQVALFLERFDPATVAGLLDKAAEVRALEAERDELRKVLEAVRSLAKDAGLASHRVAARNLQEAHGVATAALAPDDNDEGEA